jgi:hypothetical protein
LFFSLPFPEARLCAHAFGVCFWSSIIGLFGGIPLSDARGKEKEKIEKRKIERKSCTPARENELRTRQSGFSIVTSVRRNSWADWKCN